MNSIQCSVRRSGACVLTAPRMDTCHRGHEGTELMLPRLPLGSRELGMGSAPATGAADCALAVCSPSRRRDLPPEDTVSTSTDSLAYPWEERAGERRFRRDLTADRRGSELATKVTERTEREKMPQEFKAVQRISTRTILVRFESLSPSFAPLRLHLRRSGFICGKTQ